MKQETDNSLSLGRVGFWWFLGSLPIRTTGFWIPYMSWMSQQRFKSRTQLTAAVPQILWIVVARVDSHAVWIDSCQESLVVIYKILRTRVGHAQCSRFTQRTDVVAETCNIRTLRVATDKLYSHVLSAPHSHVIVECNLTDIQTVKNFLPSTDNEEKWLNIYFYPPQNWQQNTYVSLVTWLTS